MIPEHLQHRFDVCLKHIAIGQWTVLDVLAVRDPDVLIDAIDPEAFQIDERLPYWAEIWPSGIGLGIHLFEHPIRMAEPVLELGCGIGIAGIAAAKSGLNVHACDYDSDALAFTRYNAELNKVAERMTVRNLDWRSPDLTEQYRVIIGSDIVYERSNHQPIMDLLETALAPEGVFLLSDPNRSPAQSFVESMVLHGYRHTEQPRRIHFDGSDNRVTVHRFVKNG